MPSSASPSEKSSRLAGDATAAAPAPPALTEKKSAQQLGLARLPFLTTVRNWRYLYELWTGLYMLEFWEKCLFGTCAPTLSFSLSLSALREARMRSAPTPPLGRPARSRGNTDGIVTAVLLLLAYAAWRLAVPVIAVLV